MSTPTLAGVGDTVTDAWSTGSSAVQDLAATAASVATTVAAAAAEQLEDLPERVVGLAAAAKGRVHPAPRRSRKPWVLVAAGLAAFVVVAWYLRRRSSNGSSSEYGDSRPAPVTSTNERSSSVAGT